VRHHTVLHKHRQTFPFFFKIFSFIIKKGFQLISNLFGNMGVYLSYIWISLQIASAYVERNIRAIDNTLEEHQELRDNILHFIRYKHLITVQLYFIFLNLKT